MVVNAARFIRLLEIALVIAIIIVLGKFALSLIGTPQTGLAPKPLSAPMTASGANTAPLDSKILTSFDPFYRDQKATAPMPQMAEMAPETTLNLRVFGMRADTSGDSSSAIIQTPDGEQASYYLGDEIIPGVTLEIVEIDYVILNRGGTLERLSRQGKTEDESGAAVVQVNVDTLSFEAKDFVNDLRFYPAREGRQVIGYKVRSQRGTPLSKFGLKKNDIITSINGQDLTLNQVNLPNLFKNLKMARYASIQIMRDNVPMTIEVNLQ